MDVYKLQIILILIQIIIAGATIYFVKKISDMIKEHHKNLMTSNLSGLKLIKSIERQQNEFYKISNENFDNIQKKLKELDSVEEIK